MKDRRFQTVLNYNIVHLFTFLKLNTTRIYAARSCDILQPQLWSNTGVCALSVEPLPTQDLNVCIISYSLL